LNIQVGLEKYLSLIAVGFAPSLSRSFVVSQEFDSAADATWRGVAPSRIGDDVSMIVVTEK
jgi:hypothetical protein